MSADIAHRPERDEDHSKVDSQATPHPSGVHFAEAIKAEGDADPYLPGKWSWGPTKASFDW